MRFMLTAKASADTEVGKIPWMELAGGIRNSMRN